MRTPWATVDGLGEMRRTALAALGVALLTAVAAVAITLPAPLPGHVVSANDTVTAVTPFTQGPLQAPGRAKNPQLTDPAQVFRPDLYWARQQVRSGHLPAWSPLAFGGWPLLASQQAAPLFPVTGLSYVLPYEQSIAWRIIALLVLAAVGTFLFAVAIGLGRLSAAMAGVAYGLSGPLVVWSMHPQTDVHAMVGWMLLGVTGAVRGRRWGLPVLAAAVGCAGLGGHPQSVFIDGMLVAAWAVFSLAVAPSGQRLRGGLLVLAGVALGLLAAAVVLVPFAELLGQTSVGQRGGRAGPTLAALMSAALPDVWGRPDWAFTTDSGTLVNYLERTAFVGAVPLLLALVGLVVRRGRLRWFFVGVALVSIVLAYDVPGISGWLVAQWPFRLANMSRILSVFAFCVALLGGLGLQALIDEPGALARRRTIVALAVVVAVPIVWALARFHVGGLSGVLGFLPGVANPTSSEQAVVSAIAGWAVACAVGCALLVWLVRGGGRTAAATLVAFTALALGFGWHGFLPVLDTGAAGLPRTASIAVLQARQGDGRIVAGAPLGGAQALVPNVGEYFGLRDARGRGVPTVDRTTTAWSALGGASAENYTFVDPSNPLAARALRLFGVRAALVAAGAPAPPGSRLLHHGADGDVYAIRGTLPRAFVACGWRTASRGSAPARLARGTVAGLRDDPLVEGAPAVAAPCAQRAVAAQVTTDTPDEVGVTARSTTGGRLVLLDTWYPGWEATVDGHPVSIAPTDVAFRSVPVAPGTHRVVFRYRSTAVRTGVIVSLLAWLAIAALAIAAGVAGRRRRRPAAA